jgi:hypothetical protein
MKIVVWNTGSKIQESYFGKEWKRKQMDLYFLMTSGPAWLAHFSTHHAISYKKKERNL